MRLHPILRILIALALLSTAVPTTAQDAPEETPEKTPEQKQEEAEAELPPTPEEPDISDDDLWHTQRDQWDRWLDATRNLSRLATKGGKFRARVGVRFQFDWTVVFEKEKLKENIGSQENSFDLRRGRIFLEGLIWKRIAFRFEWDLAVDRGVKDAYIDGFKRALKFAWLRLGNFKEPFSLERQRSAFNITNLEWSLPVATFVPGRNAGAMLYNTGIGERLSWAVGAFSLGNQTDGNQSASALTFTGRITGLPYYAKEGRRLLHFGLSASLRKPRGGETQYTARPEARFVDAFADTGAFDADRTDLFGAELALTQGPLWFQGEWVGAKVDAPDSGDPFFSGWYFEAGYFLTGEHRPYNRHAGIFARLRPEKPYHRGNLFKKGVDRGALAVSARWNTVDLNSGGIQGGQMRDLNLGMSWFMNRSSRFTFNYVHSNVQNNGKANIFLLRYGFNPTQW
jgi:phosphate-selective porin OprO and OprP